MTNINVQSNNQRKIITPTPISDSNPTFNQNNILNPPNTTQSTSNIPTTNSVMPMPNNNLTAQTNNTNINTTSS